MKLMINNSIEYYVDANPEDSLKKIRQNDKIIIIESKKDPKKKFTSLGMEIEGNILFWIIIWLNWQMIKLRVLIVEKDYYYINDDSYFPR